MILRPRQEEFVRRCHEALRTNDNTLGVAPTGAGKTVMLSSVAGGLLQDGAQRVLILQHRDELVTQNRSQYHAINGYGRPSGLIDADTKDFLKPVLFGMVQTLSRDANLAALKPVDLLVVDEAHHTAAASYRKIIDRAREINPKTKLLGVTATPNRGDKKGLKGIFDNVADQITLGELIASGALVRPRTFVVDIGVREELRQVKRNVSDFDMQEVAAIMDKGVLNDQIVQKWKEQAGDRQTVVFCSTVEHANHVAGAFAAAGVAAQVVTGDTPSGERASLLSAFDRGEFQVLVNVAVLTEGWDCQPVSCVVLLRPSSYASTMIQMIGRGLRRLDPELYQNRPPKNDCIVLDFGTSVLTHGSLEQNVDLDPFKGEGPKKTCPECESTIPMGCRECAICGHVFENILTSGVASGSDDNAPLGSPADFVLTEIDLFKQSPFKWESLWDGAVLVATAFDAWAVAVARPGGNWHAIGGAKDKGIHVLNVGDKLLSLSTADDWMREHGDRAAAAKSKRWLHMPASTEQLRYLGLAPEAAKTMTRYQAACHLTFKFNERALKGKLAA